jgi:hypothetical protein
MPPEGEQRPSPHLPQFDEAGKVFFRGDRVLRGIRKEHVPTMEALLRSGLLEELERRGWIVPTQRSNERIAGFEMVIEHPRLPFVRFPFEWSFGMLRDAALHVLDVNIVANSFGWELKDCHGYNVIFAASRPVWVDIGSLVPRPPGATGWLAENEFARAYAYPLRMWCDGTPFLARRLLSAEEVVQPGDFALYRWPWLRRGGRRWFERMANGWYLYRLLAHQSDQGLTDRWPRCRRALALWLKRQRWLPGRHVNVSRLRNEIRRLRRHNVGGEWSAYQSRGASFVQTPRFNRIAGLVSELGGTSIIELAGNQGWLSERLLKERIVSTAICTDADEAAVDQAYERSKHGARDLEVAVVNLVRPTCNAFTTLPSQRLRADTVLALAVSHHLLLSQGMDIDAFMEMVSAYGHRHVLVEFMPLGLWNGRGAPPPTPSWYNLRWFRAAFTKVAREHREETLEPNRILFWGEIRREGVRR